jgi:hypothetical protein
MCDPDRVDETGCGAARPSDGIDASHDGSKIPGGSRYEQDRGEKQTAQFSAHAGGRVGDCS